ncbi:YhcB family protein [Neisseria arctica]|uniref:YhcB family protein n=1 Tax=Neisseria arctica TaxID=1470200 RepID=UPI00069AA2C2|nr:DUF1043 family protein [Neisseria arctica]UOO87344.1 DUF1043 family protein [Neisseria arctica]
MNTLPWEVQLILAFVIGLAVGILITWLLLRQNKAKQKEHEELVQTFQHYRQDVDKHFIDTAAAVDELNRSYQKVIQHLSTGAQSLMGKEALQEQLALRSNKSVTVSYLAVSAVAPAASEITDSILQSEGMSVEETDAHSPEKLEADIAEAVQVAPPSDLDPDEQIPVSEVPVTDAPHVTELENTEQSSNLPKS